VDKRAVLAPKASDLAESQEYGAATDELETQLTKIWETVLDKTPIGIRDASLSWVDTLCWPRG
jgi:hypothetical protein